MASLRNDIRAVLKKIRSVAVLQWVGNLALILFAMAWLQLPDSHVWEFTLSIVFGVSILLVFLWIYAKTVGHLLASTTSIWLRMLFLVIFVALWLLLLQPIALGREKEMLFAGYWNSKLPPHLRVLFSYPRLVALQGCFYDLCRWIIAGLLLPFALEVCAFGWRSTAFKRVCRVYLRWIYWVAVVFAGFMGTALTNVLTRWTPGKGLTAETISLFTRLGVVYTVDIFLWCLVLGFATVYLDEVGV